MVKCFAYLCRKYKNMDANNIILIICVVIMVFMGLFMLRKDNNDKNNTPDAGEKRNDDNDIRVVSQKIIVPLKIQACERLLLYIERIQFPLLVKRIFYPGISRDDFHFSMLQNVQDEFEHNLAQRLYVSEETWMLVTLAKEEVLQNISAVFNDNPQADAAMMAQTIASLTNPMVDKAVISIKIEFNSL